MCSAKCVVCGDGGHGVHFGVEACRACAAFFRRTVIGGRSYRCRFDGRCEIGVGVRCSCRACRLNKCLSMGMDSTSVHVKLGRDHLAQRGVSTTSPVNFSTPPLLKCEVKNEEHGHGTVPTNTDAITIPSPSSAFAAIAQTSSSSSCTPLMDKMLRGYRKYCTMRETASVIALNSEGPIRKMLEGQVQLREGNYSDNVVAVKRDFALLTELMNDHFWPAVGEVSTETKWVLFRNFFSPFMIAERSYASIRMFPNPEDTRFLISPHHFIDSKNLENFFAVTECKTDPKQMATIFRPTLYQVNTLIVKAMRRVEPSEEEFIGLVGLLLWDDSDVNIGNENDANVVERAKLSIHDELYRVCCSRSPQQLAEAAERFGTLINTINFCRKMSEQAAENFSLANAASIFEIDQFLHSLNPSAW